MWGLGWAGVGLVGALLGAVFGAASRAAGIGGPAVPWVGALLGAAAGSWMASRVMKEYDERERGRRSDD
jgi:phage tail tape-measure protein